MWKRRTTLCKNSWRVYRLLIIFSPSGFPVIIKFQPAACTPHPAKKTCRIKRDLVVASTRHHRAPLLKYYQRPPCVPSFVKSRMLPPLQTHFLLFQQIFFVLVCIHPGNARVPPRVLASGLKPCGGNYQHISYFFEIPCMCTRGEC